MLALCALAPLAQAQYKVIDANGKVTYTDQPPATPGARVQSVKVGPSAGAPPLSTLPAELRAAAGKYPVTLYSGPGCRPCDSGRQLLLQRGIPFAERRVESAADAQALSQLSGERSLPLLTIGSQQLKGLVSADWHSYLDAAGYPRESKLTASYRAPAATPLAPPAAPAPTAEVAAPTPAPVPEPRTASGPNIRF